MKHVSSTKVQIFFNYADVPEISHFTFGHSFFKAHKCHNFSENYEIYSINYDFHQFI